MVDFQEVIPALYHSTATTCSIIALATSVAFLFRALLRRHHSHYHSHSHSSNLKKTHHHHQHHQQQGKIYPLGPKPLPLLGNYFTISKLQTDADGELRRLARRFGEVCMLWYGSNPVVIVSTPKAARDLLVEVCTYYCAPFLFLVLIILFFPSLKKLSHFAHGWGGKKQKGGIYSSGPDQIEFRSHIFPYRLLTVPAGEDFRFLRRLYHGFLGPQQAVSFRKYQDYESKVMLCNLLDHPQSFLQDTERFAMSVIFSAVYGVRVADLRHPIIAEFTALWREMLKCEPFFLGDCGFKV